MSRTPSLIVPQLPDVALPAALVARIHLRW